VIEYCGGTEIGGSFLSSTMIQPNVPSMFSTPVLGSNILILNDNGIALSSIVSGSGEVTLIPPILGLSTRLLNRDHHSCYYDDMPSGPAGELLRRHGDEIEQVYDEHLQVPVTTSTTDNKTSSTAPALPYYRALGRCDDTMNLGGIKISSVEIERVCNLTEGIHETAAIAISPPLGGPSQLILYAVLTATMVTNMSTQPSVFNITILKNKLQLSIKNYLNPLFHITDIVIGGVLPRTASNKIMRRILRDEYMNKDELKQRNNSTSTTVPVVSNQ